MISRFETNVRCVVCAATYDGTTTGSQTTLVDNEGPRTATYHVGDRLQLPATMAEVLRRGYFTFGCAPLPEGAGRGPRGGLEDSVSGLRRADRSPAVVLVSTEAMLWQIFDPVQLHTDATEPSLTANSERPSKLSICEPPPSWASQTNVWRA